MEYPQHQQQPLHYEQHHVQAQPAQSQEWSTGLASTCSPCGDCCFATFLPCILLGKTSTRLRDPTMQSYDALNSDCVVMGAITWLTGCGWIYAMGKRTEIRERFGIKGSGCGDCCVSYWCPCCILVQQEKEVKARTAQGPIMQGYSPQKEGMQVYQ